MKTEIERRKKININFNIGPLIDVVFQLLLFFALTSYFVSNPGIPVSLPESQEAGELNQDNAVIYINSKNEIFFKGEMIGLEELNSALKSSNNKSVILKADKNVHLEFIVAVMDRVKSCGIRDLIIATKPEAKAR